ncbi:MAG: hypothetical protein EBT15_11270 [Betaproteobacteria bacterium]|nr:hypothetical protein [Betaproteobacteria bacterium]
MKTITITMADDGTLTVDSPDMDQPYQCESVDECLEYVSDMIKGEESNEPYQAEEKAEPDVKAMWNQEAAKRPQNPNLMR